MSNYIYNILTTLTIISNYFDVKKKNHHLFFDYKIPQSRGSIINRKKGSKKITLIDESYNSNPLSLKFALERYDALFKKKDKKIFINRKHARIRKIF